MKQLSVILLVLLCISSSQAQMFLRFGTGYSLSMGGMMIDEKYNSNASTTTAEGVYGTFGAGLHFEGALGTTINDNFSAEVGVGYLLATSHESNSVSTPSNYQSTTKITSSLFSVTPALTVMTAMGTVKPYSRFGVIIALPGIVLDGSSSPISGNSSSKHTLKMTMSGGVALGFNGAFGVLMPMGNLTVFGEVNAVSMGWGPSKWKSENNGQTIEGNYKTSVKSSNSSSNPNPDQLKPSLPFGNIGVNIGLMLPL
jgi:hypothetical protein